MTDEKVPQVGENVLYLDADGDWVEGEITSVGEMDETTGLYPVEVDGLDILVLWSDVDAGWVEDNEEEE